MSTHGVDGEERDAGKEPRVTMGQRGRRGVRTGRKQLELPERRRERQLERHTGPDGKPCR